MKRIALIAAAAAMFAAAPAMAGEYRLEARGGIAWSGGQEEPVIGGALGYDFDLGDTMFAGVELSLDKVLNSNLSATFGGVARVGARIGGGKAYVLGGYGLEELENPWIIGGGYSHKVSSSAYVKAEYRRYMYDQYLDANAVVVGVGVEL